MDLKKIIKKITAFSVAAALCITALSGCSRETEQPSGAVEQSNASSAEAPQSAETTSSSPGQPGAESGEADNSEETISNASELIAEVGNEEITVADLGYNIYNNAIIQMQKADPNTTGDIGSFDWTATDENGDLLSNVVVKQAIDDTINDCLFRQRAQSAGYIMSDEEKERASNLVSNAVANLGEEEFLIRANSMGILSADIYQTVYVNSIIFQDVSNEMYTEPEKYIDDVSVLADYTGDRGATVQHILIMDNTEKGDAYTIASEVAQRAKNGEDFEALMNEYNEDEAEVEQGYTFPVGQMVASFEDASFNLGIGEISDPVQSDYGYHVIRRYAGAYELMNYWRANSDVNIVDNAEELVDFDDFVQLIKSANESLNQSE
ncbi:MAG TPA: peptidylprolyl isomerase [Firmicutes bacterium]|nr:peptidylprolyl isomerase [Bacillota bacterium]